MNRLKSSELGDRLSELPDTLILHILSLLPMRDVVRTTVVSKRWEGLWTSVPSLVFDAENKSTEKFCSFVNRAMLRWKGTELHKFSLNFPFTRLSVTGDVDTWLHVAIEKGVEELCMDLKRDVYSPPQSLYSCSTIRKASLLHCVMKIKGNVHWDQLKSLRIELEWLSEDVIQKVMLGAPQMEILILSFKDCSENLNIRSNSLKRLMMERNEYPADVSLSPSYSTVRIWTPNIETLEVSGMNLLGNVSSLTRAKVGFIIDPFYVCSDAYRKLRGMSENFLQNFRHLEKVTLSDLSVKVIQEIKKENKDMVAPLSNVKFLTIYAACVDDVVALLKIFPALTVLVLLEASVTDIGLQFFEIACPSTTTCISEFDAEKSLQPKSVFLVPHLRTIEITWALHDNSILRLIDILAISVAKLEKMVLRVKGTESGVPTAPLLLASQKLLCVQKAFPAADVIIMGQD